MEPFKAEPSIREAALLFRDPDHFEDLLEALDNNQPTLRDKLDQALASLARKHFSGDQNTVSSSVMAERDRCAAHVRRPGLFECDEEMDEQELLSFISDKITSGEPVLLAGDI